MELRPYQRKFFAQVRERYDAGVTRQLGVLATGLGKAVLFAALREQMQFRKKVMVLVHREELATQAADKLSRWNPDLRVGVEMANRYSDVDGIFPDTFVVASVPTLGRRGSARIKKFLPDEYDCIVSDEAHHSSSPQWRNVLTHFGLTEPGGTILSLGLTATPNRSDGTGLRQNFDEIVFDMGIREGIESGYLVDLRGIRVNTKTNLDKVKTRAGDFAEDELADAVNTVERNAIIVKEWMAAAYGLKTVVFTVDIQHAVDLAAAFCKCSVPADAVWGSDPDRKSKLHRHRTGQITVLCNCAVLTEGYDDPGIKCIVLAKPTKSTLLFTQMIGRGTRIDDGKSDCILEGTPVLTDKGLVPIEQVRITMKVWDGQNWVSHGGAVCRGVQEIVEYEGLYATPDHKMWTCEGWKEIGLCKLQGTPLWRGELGGEAIEVPAHIAPRGEAVTRRVEGNGYGWMYDMWKRRVLGGGILRGGTCRMPPVWKPDYCPSLAFRTNEPNEGSLLESKQQAIRGLWRKGRQVFVRFASRLCGLYQRGVGIGSEQADRSNRQRRALCARESSSVNETAESIAHAEASTSAIFSRVPRPLPRSEVCGFYPQAAYLARTIFLSNKGAVENPVFQAKGRVWDILNAGPLHRFTASGFIVSNCLILDVVDNTTKHSLVTMPSLLGLPANLDLKGKSVIKAKEQFERVAKEFPSADLSGVLSLSKLDSIAENISLFQVSYPPEISKLSELGWRKSGDGYMLAVKRDLITITKDLRDEYKIVGNLEGQVITLSAQNLPGAFNVADGLVSRDLINVVRRDARWHGDKPTEKQLGLCRILKIPVPDGVTKGQVSAAIDAKRAQIRSRA
jgi:superfamily II DNA or RNA helicase